LGIWKKSQRTDLNKGNKKKMFGPEKEREIDSSQQLHKKTTQSKGWTRFTMSTPPGCRTKKKTAEAPKKKKRFM